MNLEIEEEQGNGSPLKPLQGTSFDFSSKLNIHFRLVARNETCIVLNL